MPPTKEERVVQSSFDRELSSINGSSIPKEVTMLINIQWMLMSSTCCLFTWGAGWCYIKYKLGWIYTEEYGAIPYPTEMFSQKYVNFRTVFTIIFNGRHSNKRLTT